MSSEHDGQDGPPSDGPGAGPGGDGARRRRRRRRRRGAESPGSGSGTVVRTLSGSGAVSGPGERPASVSVAVPGSGAGPSGPSAGSAGGAGSGLARGSGTVPVTGPGSARDPSEPRRRRRRRGRDTSGGGERPDAARSARPGRERAVDPAGRAPGDVAPAAGWRPAPSPGLPARVPTVPPDEDDAGPSAAAAQSPDEAWGDDSAAPTAEVTLAADLPPDPPADDLDPVTAALESPDGADPDAAGAPPRSLQVCNLIGVKFTSAGKIYLFDAGDDAYPVGEEVVVDTERGPRVGRVAVAPVRQETNRSGLLRRVLRRPSRADQRRLDANRERAEDALRAAKQSARELGLAIKVFRAELSLGGGKALIYFSSDDKIDVRRLMRDLSQKLHLRIEVRQTGVRDEAKMVGGIGSCGQELCCTTWLPAFVPVSIKNAKDQGLVLNPTKVSGQCGRLKCCLVYEQATYAELRRGLPKLGKRVVTASGEGRVVEVDVLRQRVRVSLVGGEAEIFEARDVQPMFPSQPGGRPGDQQG